MMCRLPYDGDTPVALGSSLMKKAGIFASRRR
jgi:hypothetical protein